jgi:hypothetical protein
MARQRLDTKQAAEALGITPDAVRKRASRGQLESDKDPDGKLHIWLDTDAPQSGQDDRERLIEFLYEQLEREREANRENRRLLAAALERIPAIEPPPDTPSEPRESPQTVSGNTGDARTPTEQEKPIPLWRRIFGVPRDFRHPR